MDELWVIKLKACCRVKFVVMLTVDFPKITRNEIQLTIRPANPWQTYLFLLSLSGFRSSFSRLAVLTKKNTHAIVASAGPVFCIKAAVVNGAS